VNGKVLTSPGVKVLPSDEIAVDGQAVGARPATRVWRYSKPNGLLTTHNDPQGRETVFQKLPKDMGRVISVGRLDLNSEGLLLLTNDGALARVLELPATGWTRRYRVRAYGKADDAQMASLAKGTTVEGVVYGPVEVSVDRRTGANVWLTVGLKEGKNREVRKVLSSIGLTVNRLMRVAYGPFQLGSLKSGDVSEVKLSILRDQLGKLYPLDANGFPAGQAPAGSGEVPVSTGTAKAKPKKSWARNAPKTHTEKRKAAAKTKSKRDGVRGDASDFMTSKEGRNANRRRRP
jgi:23S rRNA pseudouridine2605 synthase